MLFYRPINGIDRHTFYGTRMERDPGMVWYVVAVLAAFTMETDKMAHPTTPTPILPLNGQEASYLHCWRRKENDINHLGQSKLSFLRMFLYYICLS